MTTSKIKFFVCGQVDSGKSTLIGNLLYKSGSILKLDNTSSEATKFSDLLDVDQSERERGITQYSSNSLFTFNNIEFEAIDTPGHLLYIRELINSMSSNKGSVGCLIISSLKSDFMKMFEDGTTKEDAILMRCCGVNHVVILINKIDKENADVEFVKQTFNEWISRLGFKTIVYCPISGYQGLNLFDRMNPDEMCFIECLIHLNSKIKRVVKEKITKNKDKCKLDFHTFNLNKIVAVGYKSVFHIVEHSSKHEIVGEIVKIQNKEDKKFKPFLKSNENNYLYVQLDEMIELTEGQRLILRDNTNTIGFGYVTFS
jgi:small GTP-binding protein